MSMLLDNVPRRVRIVEVGPRDGLQNEQVIVPTQDKLHFIITLALAGFSEIETTSFVNPKRVPQLADADEVLRLLPARPGLRYTALVPNRRGLDRAIAAGTRSIALFTAASETFSQRNVGMSIAESLAEFEALIPVARDNGMRVRAYVSTAFVCPFEGLLAPDRVVPVVDRLIQLGVDEVSLGDTIGHATPTMVAELTTAIADVLPIDRTAYHFHDTRGLALANVLMALELGISVFDSAAGGTGGCPFAPGAAGNVSTEGLLTLLHGMRIETGINLPTVQAATSILEECLGRTLVRIP